MMSNSDDGVMSTNDDATICKGSAVNRGYWEDPFLQYFMRGGAGGPADARTGHGAGEKRSPSQGQIQPLDRKPPEINRGYYARVSAVNHLLQQFLQVTERSGQCCQIVNFGCGFDTLFWRLKALYKVNHVKNFVDCDLDGVTTRKVYAIRHRPPLLALLGEDIKFSSSELHSNHYHLIAADIRSLNQLSAKLFTECGLEKGLPTVFLTECVLVYLPTDNSNSLLSWISSTFSHCLFINYEQVNLMDRFGEIMIENLRLRNCELLGLEPCRDLETQRLRFISNGWSSATAWDMNAIYEKHLPKAEIQRIEGIEFLDEKDLLEQLLNHYCVVVASKGLSELSKNETQTEIVVGF